jgi:flavin-dependent dehydrogenase
MSSKKIYDVVIIGGGLGGLCLAIQQAKAGKSVVLFEKETYPFHKVCGEYISMESYDFVKGLGVPLDEMAVPKINRVNISAPNGVVLERPLALGGFGISRYTLDNKLANIAKELGVNLLDGTKVNQVNYNSNSFTITTSKEEYKSTIACGAYGKRSTIDVQMQRDFIKQKPSPQNNYIGVKYHITLDYPDDLISLHNFSDGYCGISKVDDNRYCLCYLTTAHNLQKYGSILEMEKNVVIQNPYLKEIFTSAGFLYKQPLTISQVTFDRKATVEKHLLMLGDAAGTIAPLCGNGMSMAMRASFELNKLLNQYFDKKINRAELEQQYTLVWHKNFSFRIKAGRTLQKLFGKEILTNASIGLLKSLPAVTDKLIKLTHGKPF